MDKNTLFSRFDSVCQRISRAMDASNNHNVTLIAVSKKHDAKAVSALASYWAQYSPTMKPVFGENYIQEALEKIAETESLLANKVPSPFWHFIGHLQSRKAKEAVGVFSLIHTVDSEKLAHQIQKAAQTQQSKQAILLQINIGDEEQKGGVLPEQAEKLAQTILGIPEITLCGLMCLPPYNEQAETSRPYFQAMFALKNRLEQNLGIKLPELSMGMSHDFEVAIQEGATMIRVGTDIFGERV